MPRSGDGALWDATSFGQVPKELLVAGHGGCGGGRDKSMLTMCKGEGRLSGVGYGGSTANGEWILLAPLPNYPQATLG